MTIPPTATLWRYSEPHLDDAFAGYLADARSDIRQVRADDALREKRPQLFQDYWAAVSEAQFKNELRLHLEWSAESVAAGSNGMAKHYAYVSARHCNEGMRYDWLREIGLEEMFLKAPVKRTLLERYHDRERHVLSLAGAEVLHSIATRMHRRLCRMLLDAVPDYCKHLLDGVDVPDHWKGGEKPLPTGMTLEVPPPAPHLLNYERIPSEWGLFVRTTGADDHTSAIERSRQVLVAVLREAAAAARVGIPYTGGFNPMYEGFDEVHRLIDALKWHLPPALLHRPFVPPRPELPKELLEVYMWPTMRFDKSYSWEAQQHGICKADEDPLGQSIWLGVDGRWGALAECFQRHELTSHCYVHGPTKSHKTGAVLLPLLVQIIRGSDETDPVNSEHGAPAPLLVVDLKGDRALYHRVRLEAQRRGQRFRLLTPDIYDGEDGVRLRKTDILDVFDNLRHLSRYPAAAAALVAQAFEIEQGRGYGADHFATLYTKGLAKAFARGPRSWTDLAAAVSDHRDYAGLRAKLELLTYEPVAHVLRARAGVPEEAIVDMPSVIANREVVYVFIPQGEGGRPGLAIAQLALACFTNALWRFNKHTFRRAYVCIDEFQDIAGANIGRNLKQIRGNDSCCFILCNQSPTDLDGIRYGLSEMVQNEPGIQIITGIRSPEVLERLQKLSGEEIRYLPEFGQVHTEGASEDTTEGESWGSGASWTEQSGRSSGTSTMEGSHESLDQYGLFNLRSSSRSQNTGSTSSVGRGGQSFESTSRSRRHGKNSSDVDGCQLP